MSALDLTRNAGRKNLVRFSSGQSRGLPPSTALLAEVTKFVGLARPQSALSSGYRRDNPEKFSERLRLDYPSRQLGLNPLKSDRGCVRQLVPSGLSLNREPLVRRNIV